MRSDTLPARPLTSPRQRSAGDAPPAAEGLRLFTISLALGLLVFAQRSGQVATDTKLDLVVDPARFLVRALSLWDPTAKAGGLDNQAYGYLFPMGPFFLGGHWLHLSPWVVQRAWESALLIGSFLGVFRVARLLGTRGTWPPIVAGLVYALSPRMLSELTSISAELTPTAALPWILAPLIRGSAGGSPRRSAAWSGVAILFCGGTNAAATLAVLPVPALWLLTRQPGRRRRALIGYWLAAVVLAILWWALPLVLLGRYSPPFLDWIEAAQNTTYPTSLSAVLRGVPHWENYLGPGVWPAGWIFVSSHIGILATTAVAAAGLFGLAHPRMPHRSFLFACLGAGLVLLTLGHRAAVGPPFAGDVRTLLDGPLVAFRNIHKFEPLVRLPLAIGCGAAAARVRLPAWHRWRLGGLDVRLSPRALAVGTILVLGVLAIGPAIGDRLVSQPRTQVMAPWWPKAADWLAAHSDNARALVVPGAPKPTYIWGATVDDAMDPVARSPWIARDSTPLYQAGLERLLTEVEDILAGGAAAPELAPLLARSGIGYVVLRNDLEATTSAATPQSIVRATLAGSPGLRLVQRYGPSLGGAGDRHDVIDGGAGQARPAIEIFAVQRKVVAAGVEPLDDAVVANGTTEQLAPLTRAGLSTTVPVLFGQRDVRSAKPARPRRVATDGIRRQQASFGGTFARSATLTARARFAGQRAAYDFLPDQPGRLSTMRYVGIRDVTASSSGADAFARTNRSGASQPWSALDADPTTAWKSGSRAAVGEWLQVEFGHSIPDAPMTVSFASGLGPYPSAVRVTTDTGSRIDAVQPTSNPQTLDVPAGRMTFVRISISAVQGDGLGNSVGVTTLNIPGVAATRTLDVPDVGAPRQMVFAVAPGYRSGCLAVRVGVTCQDDLVARGEEDSSLDRSIHLRAAAAYNVQATVRLPGGAKLDELLDRNLAVQATASSVQSPDPRVRPGAAVDGDARTTWIAAAGDRQPSLTLDLGRRSLVRGVRLRTDPGSAAAAPTRVRVTAGSQVWRGTVPASGSIVFAHPVDTSTVKIVVLEAELRKSTSMLTGQATLLPAGLTSVIVSGADDRVSFVPDTLRFSCADGLVVGVDGIPVPLSVTAPTAAVLAGQPVHGQPCDGAPIRLAAGPHRFVLARTDWALPVALNLREGRASLSGSPGGDGASRILGWQSTHRRIAVDVTRRSVLVVHENFNRGWTARVGDRTLSATEIDGWQQGFVIPAGTKGVVVLDYRPQRSFDVGLIVGVAAILILVVGAAVGAAVSDSPPCADRRLPLLAPLIGVTALGWLLAGLPGVATVVVVSALQLLLEPGGKGLAGRLAAGAMIFAGVDVAIADPLHTFTTANSGAVQLLTLGAVALSASAVLRLRSLGRHGRVP